MSGPADSKYSPETTAVLGNLRNIYHTAAAALCKANGEKGHDLYAEHQAGLVEVFFTGVERALKSGIGQGGRERSNYSCESYEGPKDGKFYWRVTDLRNGQVTGASHQGYEDIRDCDHNFAMNTGWEYDVVEVEADDVAAD